jgi:peptide/nickel transport system substrate-binding protein
MRKTSRRSFIKGATATGTIAAFGGLAPYYRRAHGQARKHLTYLQTEPMTSSWDVTSHTILGQIYFEQHVFGKLIQTPMRQDNPEEIVYDLATSQKVIDDKTIEYTLRDDVFFHAGQKFGPEDVKATFEYASNPERPAGSWYPGQAAVEIVDSRTVRVRAANGSYPGSLFWFLAGFLPIMSADDIKNKALDQRPNGTGYFKFVSREGQTTKAVANEKYYGGKPPIEEYFTTFVGDANTRLLSLLNGEADLIDGIEPEQYETLLTKNVTVQRTISTSLKYLHFRCHRPPFGDVRLRHAACHAINRDLLLEIMGPAGQKSVGQISPVKFGYTDNIPGTPEYDPARCQQLLAEAGFPKGNGLPEIEYLVSVGFYPKTKELGELITAMLQEQGFPVKLTVMEVAAWLDKVFDLKSDTAPQLADSGWGTGSPEPNLVLRPMWHSSGSLLSNCGSKEIDALIEKQQQIVDPTERRKSIQTELMPGLAKQMPSLGLFTQNMIHGHNKGLKDHYIYPSGPVDLSKANYGA